MRRPGFMNSLLYNALHPSLPGLRCDDRRNRRKTAVAVIPRRHGSYANHTKDLGRIAGSIRSRRRSIRPHWLWVANWQLWHKSPLWCSLAQIGRHDNFQLMRDLLLLTIHLLVTLAKLLGPGGARQVAAESLLLKHQLLISNRSRQRAPNLTMLDRLVLGLTTLFVSPHRIPKLSRFSSRPRYSNSTRRWSIENTVCCSPLPAGNESLDRKALPHNSSRPSSR